MGAGPAWLRVRRSSFFEEETAWLVTLKEGSSPVRQGIDLPGRQENRFPFTASLHLSDQPLIFKQTSQEVRRNVSLTCYLNHW